MSNGSVNLIGVYRMTCAVSLIEFCKFIFDDAIFVKAWAVAIANIQALSR